MIRSKNNGEQTLKKLNMINNPILCRSVNVQRILNGYGQLTSFDSLDLYQLDLSRSLSINSVRYVIFLVDLCLLNSHLH